MTEQEKQAFVEWAAQRPIRIRECIAILDGCHDCYLSLENPGHYAIFSYEEHGDAPATVKIVHGRDSYGAGSVVFGVPPQTLVPCDCGKWESPTDEQTFEYALRNTCNHGTGRGH